MKKELSAILSLAMSTTVFAQTFQIYQGWALFGTDEPILVSKFLGNSAIDEVIVFKNGKYQYGANGDFQQIDAQSGFWVYANDNTYIDTDTDTPTTQPTAQPTAEPTAQPTAEPTAEPTLPADPDAPIEFNGKTYIPLISESTGKRWLDRNLGASQVCESLTDTECYGDYYQWGRSADGHQLVTSRTTSTDATNVKSVGHGKFILGGSIPYDWSSADEDGSERVDNWTSTNASALCPVGYRVPTSLEVTNEMSSANDNIDAFHSFLKLPTAGSRSNRSGDLINQGTEGSIWTSNSAGKYGYFFQYNNVKATVEPNYRANGYTVRCIED